MNGNRLNAVVDMPEAWTYPDIQPHLIREVQKRTETD